MHGFDSTAYKLIVARMHPGELGDEFNYLMGILRAPYTKESLSHRAVAEEKLKIVLEALKD